MSLLAKCLRPPLLLLLRSLLADRFQLATHRETKTLSAYAIALAKGGPKFSPYFQRMKDGGPYPPDRTRLQLGGSLKNFSFLPRANIMGIRPFHRRIGSVGEYPSCFGSHRPR
jgi:uncharacterized protein (TIGR03435 family)